jgi:hypothetical protein
MGPFGGGTDVLRFAHYDIAGRIGENEIGVIMIGVKRTLRVYADTSVFGGCFDDEFRAESVGFFEEVRAGRFVLVVSDVTLDELALAPESVRRILADLPPSQIEVVNSSEESNALKQAYLDAGVVGPASRNDAAHIALATIFGADLVVSWNFKHIVHFEKIAGYEGVNSLRGYRSPKIYSPREVVKT